MTSPSASALAAELASLRRQVEALARASQMSRRSVEDGGVKVFDADGNLRGIIGVQEDGTTALVTVNDPTPPTPSAPIVFPVPGGLEVTWDGTFLDYAGQPSDFGKLEVHAYTEDVYTPTEATRCAILPAAGTVTIDLPTDAYTVVFVAYSTGGAASSPSLGATETPAAAGEDTVARQIAADAQTKADTAIANATAAQQAAEAAEQSAAAVTGDVATAQQAADDAATQAAAALTAAQSAASTGTSAQQAADLAASAAQAAQEAADAAGTDAAAADAKAAQAAATAAQAIADAAAAKTRADTGVTNAATALTAANGKNRIFTQATKPTGTAYIAGDLWIDTANGRRLSAWDPAAASGAGDWVVQQFGNLAIAPNTLVASDVLVQGTVTAALIKGDAIDGKTITGATVRTSASGQRVEMDSTNGLRGINAAGTVKTKVGTDGTLTAVDASLTGSLRTVDSGTGVELVSGTGSLVGRGIVRFPDAADGSDPPPLLVRDVGTSSSSLTMWGSQKYTLYPHQGYVSVREYAAGSLGTGTPASSEVIVNGDAITLGGHSLFRQRVWHTNRAGNASDVIAVGSYVTLVSQTITGAPAGDYQLTFRAVVSNASAAAGFTQITVNGFTTADGSPRADCIVVNGRHTFSESVAFTHTGGDMTVRGAYNASAGTPTVWTQGTQLTAAYLGPRAIA